MSAWVYELHMGGLCASDEPIPDEDLYCEQCGDSDWEIGKFETLADFLWYWADNIYVDDGDGGYPLGDVLDDVAAWFDDVMTYDEAADIVRAAKTKEDDK